MPKPRGNKVRRFEKRLFIVCEGSKEKSEDAYLSGFLKTCKIPETVKVEIVETKQNTGRELVKKANECKEFDHDEAWVVYDKDGYTKHPETFELARVKEVNIAFSAISFEMWVLLHFRYSTTSFAKSENVIRYMKEENLFEYSKNMDDMYQAIIKAGGSLETAMKNAKKIQKCQFESHASDKRYDFDAYTDVDQLILAILKMTEL